MNRIEKRGKTPQITDQYSIVRQVFMFFDRE